MLSGLPTSAISEALQPADRTWGYSWWWWRRLRATQQGGGGAGFESVPPASVWAPVQGFQAHWAVCRVVRSSARRDLPSPRGPPFSPLENEGCGETTSKVPPTVPFRTAGSLGIFFQNVAPLPAWFFSFKAVKASTQEPQLGKVKCSPCSQRPRGALCPRAFDV